MISRPRIGDRVQVWYSERWRSVMPHHGMVGTVEVLGSGRPRNHGIKLDDGAFTIVPFGNLRKPPYCAAYGHRYVRRDGHKVCPLCGVVRKGGGMTPESICVAYGHSYVSRVVADSPCNPEDQ